MAKALVVFYSRKGENYMPDGIQALEKGNTAYAAEAIQKALDADIFEIDTVKTYASSVNRGRNTSTSSSSITSGFVHAMNFS